MEETKALAVIASGLRRKKRSMDLVMVAQAIEDLSRLYGSKHEVAKRAGVSVGMLNKFLAFRRLSSEVVALVRARKVDRVMDVFWLARLRDQRKQLQLAKVICIGGLTTSEVRDIAAILNRNAQLSVADVVRRVKRSRPETRHVHAVVMPFPSLTQGRGVGKDAIATLTRSVPNSGVKLIGSAALVFFEDGQYERAVRIARKSGVRVTGLLELALAKEGSREHA